MAEYLRSDEILACVHRVALARGHPFTISPEPESPELARRRALARAHRRETLELLRELHPESVLARDVRDTELALDEGRDLVLSPRLHRDDEGRRTASVQALVRVGRVDERFTYAPVLIKSHEVVEAARTRRTLGGELARPLPSEARYHDGWGTRSSPSMTRSGLALAHATRVLDALGHGDAHARGGVIDRQRRLWWFDLASADYPRFRLDTYDRLYHERLEVLSGHDRWRDGAGSFPTAPYWHRDCPECPYASHCEGELEALDDVSLVRFTTLDQQLLLREEGVTSRERLAALDPERARRARSKPPNPLEPLASEDLLGRAIDKLDELIYRARARRAGTPLRILEARDMGCPTADVELDVDMESYEDRTYLWGAVVTLRVPLEGVEEGYRAFVDWREPTPEREAANFAAFWRWMDELRERCHAAGRTFSAYCFWSQAEDGAMSRAVGHGDGSGPCEADLEAFRRADPPEWHDLHALAKAQIQTEGPLGLKQLAGVAGFSWRDPNPSGEASILWFEVAVRDGSAEARAMRERLLKYNEDDCRATRALREWLNGPATGLPHRDDVR